jgi:hypothetical protein
VQVLSAAGFVPRRAVQPLEACNLHDSNKHTIRAIRVFAQRPPFASWGSAKTAAAEAGGGSLARR